MKIYGFIIWLFAVVLLVTMSYLVFVGLAWLIILMVPVVGTYVNPWALGGAFMLIKIVLG